MNITEFEVIAKLIRAREPVKTAVKLVLVDGKKGIEAADITGVSVQSVSNAVGRFRSADADIQRGYNKK